MRALEDKLSECISNYHKRINGLHDDVLKLQNKLEEDIKAFEISMDART